VIVHESSFFFSFQANEPSITYINQGQAYELSVKKFGDLSAYRKRLLKCQLRICFHERRLQYMEMEQINEWSAKHPGERILDVDLPLSYGVVDPVRDPTRLNVVSFKWDPSRDTGIYIKVNCISTEFTPKKHGGEKVNK
jgi:transcription factor CP2-like protein